MASITSEVVEDYLGDIERAVIADFGSDTLEEVLKQARAEMRPFVMNSDRTQQYLRDNFGKNMVEIRNTTREEVARELNEGIRAGEDYRRLTRRIDKKFGDIGIARNGIIATTEVGGAANFAIDEGYRQSGVVSSRRWVTTFLRSRPTHQALSGEERGLDEPFSIGGHTAMRPGAFGVASEDINCRCRTVVAKFLSGERPEDTTLRPDEPVIPVTPTPIPVPKPKPSPQPVSATGAPKFKPATTKGEAIDRLQAFTSGQMDLGDQSLPKLNSILKAAEETLGSAGITVENLGYITNRTYRKAYGLHEGYMGTPQTAKVSFQKKFLRNPKAAKSDDIEGWRGYKEREIAKQEAMLRLIQSPNVPSGRETEVARRIAKAKEKIKEIKDKPKYYLTMDAADDPIYAVAYHEFLHAVDHQRPGLIKTFTDKLKALGVNRPDAVRRPTEYAYFDIKEIYQSEAWTEIGTAVKIKMEVAPELKKIFLETWKDFIKSMLKRIFG